MHLVKFPAHNAVGYAFFETVETPEAVLVKSASLNAAVMTITSGTTVRLGASVPDMGWQFDPAEIERLGLSYTNKQFARQEAAEYTLELVLRGNWCLAVAPAGARTVFRGRRDDPVPGVQRGHDNGSVAGGVPDDFAGLHGRR